MTAARVQRAGRLSASVCLLAAALFAGCASPGSTATAAAGAGGGSGSTAVPGCPISQAEVEAAIGRAMSAPQVGLPAKNMTQDCSFGFGVLTTASIQFLVFDTEGQGTAFWDSVRAESPGATDIPGLADVAFVMASPRANDLFAVKGATGLHIYVFEHDPLTVEQLAALAKAALARL